MAENTISPTSPTLSQVYGEFLEIAHLEVDQQDTQHKLDTFLVDASKLNTEDDNRLLEMMGRQGVGKVASLLSHEGWRSDGALETQEIDRLSGLVARADKAHLLPAFQRQADWQTGHPGFGSVAGDRGLQDVVTVIKATRPHTAQVLELAATMSHPVEKGHEEADMNLALSFKPSAEDLKEAYDLVNSTPGLNLNELWIGRNLDIESIKTLMSECMDSTERRYLVSTFEYDNNASSEKAQAFFKMYFSQVERFGEEVQEAVERLSSSAVEKLLPIAGEFTAQQSAALGAQHLHNLLRDYEPEKKFDDAVKWLEEFISAQPKTATDLLTRVATRESGMTLFDVYQRLKSPELRDIVKSTAAPQMRASENARFQEMVLNHPLVAAIEGGTALLSNAAKHWGLVVADAPDGNGVLAVSVVGNAKKLGLKEGARITQLDGKDVPNAEAFRNVVYAGLSGRYSYSYAPSVFAAENPGGLGGSFDLKQTVR